MSNGKSATRRIPVHADVIVRCLASCQGLPEWGKTCGKDLQYNIAATVRWHAQVISTVTITRKHILAIGQHHGTDRLTRLG